jgi:hypothetical protein
MVISRRTQMKLAEITTLMLVRPPRIFHDVPWDWTRSPGVRSQHITAWITPWTIVMVNIGMINNRQDGPQVNFQGGRQHWTSLTLTKTTYNPRTSITHSYSQKKKTRRKTTQTGEHHLKIWQYESKGTQHEGKGACRAVTMQRPRDKQLYNKRC